MHILKSKPIRTPRRIMPKVRRAVGPFAKSVGELVWAYNTAHARLAGFFTVIVQRDNLQMGRAIWLALKMDGAQHDVLIAALESAKPKSQLMSRIVKNVLWATKKVNKLAKLRNDAVHMATGLNTSHPQWEIVVDQTATSSARSARLLAMKDMKRTFRLARSDLLQLAGYVTVHAIAMEYHKELFPLPRRPRLLCPQAKN